MLGRFLLCLHSHMPYVLSHGVSPHGTDWINESAAECYLPLLDVLSRLEEKGVKPRWTVNISPILAEQLEDEGFKNDFEAYCEMKIEYARSDASRFDPASELKLIGLARMWERFFTKSLEQFREKWNRSIVQGFRHFQDIGSIEVITCAATHGYLPLLATEESVRAQVELGVRTYEKHFGRKPKGIWLPECAYRPAYEWVPPAGEDKTPINRAGVEEYLALSGLEYFFVDSHMIRGGMPLGTYAGKFPQLAELFARSSTLFTPPEDERSEYEHYSLANGVVCMARDPETTVKVWSGDHGYPGDPYYLEFHKQLYPGRHRYWRISEDKRDLGKKQPYEPWQSFERLAWHAKDMVETLKATLANYRGSHDRPGTIVAMYDTELFGHWWWEGPEFLYELAVRLAEDPDIEWVTGSELLEKEPPRHKITLPEGSWGEGGYHYVWLNEGNHWTWEKLYPAQRRFAELVKHEKRSRAKNILEQAARELLLAEASDWQFLISTFSARDYAEERFNDHIYRFNRLCDLAISVMGGAKLSTSDQTFIEVCERKDSPFKEIDLNLWVSPIGNSA
jgi:1,4-alpha-glucan branching enzyme